MGRARVGGVAALVATVVGTTVAVAAGRRLVPAGSAGPDRAPAAPLDLLAVAVLVLGLAVAVGGIAVALVALADRRLDRLQQETRAERTGPDASVAHPGPDASVAHPTSTGPTGAPTGRPAPTPRTGAARPRPAGRDEGDGTTVRATPWSRPVRPQVPPRRPVGGVEEAPTVAATRTELAAGGPAGADQPSAGGPAPAGSSVRDV